ncbi:accessory Sec system protein Asp2 [Arthrobacter sulfonylureivorans]|uniref:accessory Sec system protein Asp2 n=1 Tax=Arthrobacter sulfonylureivorans TaxID=2486855 RepID=UPI0039E2D96D
MPQREQDFLHNGVLVEYKTREAKQDRRHLIVMFTGLRPRDTYDFDGQSTQENQANWLWIKDKFGPQPAYTLCRNMDFAIEDAVIALIDAELQRLGLSRNECTLAGISKGGFPALYYGIKYNFGNIIACAPQVYVGTHTRRNRPKTFAHMTGDGGDREQEVLDALIPVAVAADQGTDKNIYLFSSLQDQSHAAQAGRALPLFAKYPNFNYIETDSDLVWDHAGEIRYNLPLMLSIMAAVADNTPPRFGRVRNGNRMPSLLRSEVLSRQRQAGAAVASLTGVRLAGAVLFPEGVGFMRGQEIKSRSSQAAALVLSGHEFRQEHQLVGAGDPAIPFRYYEEAACDYKLAKFTSPNKRGIDLAGLSAGTYELRLKLAAGGREAELPLTSGTPLSTESQLDGRLYRLRSRTVGAVLDVRPVLGTAPQQAYFRLRTSWARGPRVHLDGDFAVRGVEIPDSKAARYYLVLHGPAGIHAFTLAAGGFRADPNVFGDALSDYSGAHFGTRKGTGVDVSQLPPGTYHASISLSSAGGLYTLPTGKTIQIRTTATGTTATMHDTAPLRRRGLGSVPPRDLPRKIRRKIKRRLSRLVAS